MPTIPVELPNGTIIDAPRPTTCDECGQPFPAHANPDTWIAATYYRNKIHWFCSFYCCFTYREKHPTER